MNKLSTQITKWFIWLTVFLPSAVYAQAPADTKKGLDAISGIFGSTGSYLRFNSSADLVRFVIRTMLAFAGVVALIYIIIGGYTMITSTGDPKKYEKGKQTVFYAAIGIAVIVLAFVIVTAVINIISRPPTPV